MSNGGNSGKQASFLIDMSQVLQVLIVLQGMTTCTVPKSDRVPRVTSSPRHISNVTRTNATKEGGISCIESTWVKSALVVRKSNLE